MTLKVVSTYTGPIKKNQMIVKIRIIIKIMFTTALCIDHDDRVKICVGRLVESTIIYFIISLKSIQYIITILAIVA